MPALEKIVAALRKRSPRARIIVRADSGFCREKIMAWSKGQAEVYYCLGLAKSSMLLERLDLTGRMVQLDGMHTQHQTSHQILYEQGGDYSMILRDNQPTLLKTAQQLLSTDVPPSGGEKTGSRWSPGVSGDRYPDD